MKNFIATGLIAATLFGVSACPNNQTDEENRPHWRHPDMTTEALQTFTEDLWYNVSEGNWNYVYNFAQQEFRDVANISKYETVKRTCSNDLSTKDFTLINVTVTEDNNPSYGYATIQSTDGKVNIEQEYTFNLDMGKWEFLVPKEEITLFENFTADEIVEILIEEDRCYIG